MRYTAGIGHIFLMQACDNQLSKVLYSSSCSLDFRKTRWVYVKQHIIIGHRLAGYFHDCLLRRLTGEDQSMFSRRRMWKYHCSREQEQLNTHQELDLDDAQAIEFGKLAALDSGDSSLCWAVISCRSSIKQRPRSSSLSVHLCLGSCGNGSDRSWRVFE